MASRELSREFLPNLLFAFDKSTVDDLELLVPIIQRIIDSSINSNIKYSQAELLFGN
jgi:hypothetical protein